MYWPGSNIVKSQNNDFNWRVKSDFFDEFKKKMHYSVAGQLGGIGRTKQGLERGEPFYLTPTEKAYQKSLRKTK